MTILRELELTIPSPLVDALRAIHDVLVLPLDAYEDENARRADDCIAARACLVTAFIERVLNPRELIDVADAARWLREESIRDYPLDQSIRNPYDGVGRRT